VGVLFSLEIIYFDEQKLFSFMRPHISMLSLSCCAAGVSLRKFLSIPTISRVFPTLSCIDFSNSLLFVCFLLFYFTTSCLKAILLMVYSISFFIIINLSILLHLVTIAPISTLTKLYLYNYF
jgi:hypothetical protein